MWLLGRLLPLLMGGYVPTEDPHWRCYVQLLRILTISTATEVTADTELTMNLLIRDYVVAFSTLYPHKVTPKVHYLLHLPRQLKM